MMSSTGGWKLLSFVLISALTISLFFNLYRVLVTESTVKPSDTQFDFSATWNSASQAIVNGTFCLNVKLWFDGDNITLVSTANDDDFNDWDYFGFVFDTNQNGYIDKDDTACMFTVDNKTVESYLSDFGFLYHHFRLEAGPQQVTFNPRIGYTLTVHFPFTSPYQCDPHESLSGFRQLHVCFSDWDAVVKTNREPEGVFTRFPLYIPHNS